MHPLYRRTCRVCRSPNLTPVIDLGPQFLQGSSVKPGMLMPPLRKPPTELVRCDVTQYENGCGLPILIFFSVQLRIRRDLFAKGKKKSLKDPSQYSKFLRKKKKALR